MAASLNFLANDLQLLINETKRKHVDVKEAAEKSLNTLKSEPDKAIKEIKDDEPSNLLQPIFAAIQTKNPKVIAIAVGCLQKLAGFPGGLGKATVQLVVSSLRDVLNQGVEIQLKILQTLVSLLTSCKDIHGELLSETLLLPFRLQESKIGVVSSTAAATLRQLVMFIFDNVVEEDRISDVKDANELDPIPRTSFSVTIPATPFSSSESTSIALRPSAADAYQVFEDLCSLVAGDKEAPFLKLQSLPRTFGLELVESVLTNYAPLFRKHPELILLLQTSLCPLLIRAMSDKPVFATTLRLMRVIFLLLKQFSDELVSESEIFLGMFIKVVMPGEVEGSGGHPLGSAHGVGSAPSSTGVDRSTAGSGTSPPWMRVLALEIFRGLCGDFELLKKIFERYDRRAANETSDQKATIFVSMISAFNRLATEKSYLVGDSQLALGISVGSSTQGPSSGLGVGDYSVSGMLDGMVEMAAQTASSLGVAGVTSGPPAELSVATAAMKVQWQVISIDQLDKAEAPSIPETYPFLLALQCVTSVAEGFSTFILPLYGSIVSKRPRAAGESTARVPPALDFANGPDDPEYNSLRLVRDMAEKGWSAFLASLASYITKNLDDDLFDDVLTAFQSFTTACGVLGLQMERDVFLTRLCQFAVPSSVVTKITSADLNPPPKPSSSVLSVDALGSTGSPGSSMTLSVRNLACLKSLLTLASYLAGSLGKTWFIVFEALQNADLVLRSNAARRKKRSSTLTSVPVPNSPKPSSSLGPAPPTTAKLFAGPPTEIEEQIVQASIGRLFEISRDLDDQAFRSFVSALCRLNGEMIGMPGNDLGGATDDTVSSAALSPSADDLANAQVRRRASGINVIRTLRPGEKSFGITKLGDVSIVNVHRLIYRDVAIGWEIITSHLLRVLHKTDAPPAIRIQAAEVLDKILAVAPRNVTTGGEELQSRIQKQVLEALASQAEPETRQPTTTDIDIRKMSLDTLFKILESNGHSFVTGWQRIFEILRMAWASSDTDGEGAAKSARSPVLIRVSFPSLQLICTDFLSGLSVEELRLCIGTLAEFGKQGDDVNVALTAGGLLWNVSDHLQARRKDPEREAEYLELWMFLLHQLLALCRDSRQEVRDGAIQTIFRSIELHGATLDASTWDACMKTVIFPLLDSVNEVAALVDSKPPPSTPAESASDASANFGAVLPSKQWDDSKILAFNSSAGIVSDFLISKLVETPAFSETWSTFISHLKRSFLEDRDQVATAAMKCFGRVTSVSVDHPSEAASKLESSWLAAYSAWEQIGNTILENAHSAAGKSFSQANLEAFVRVVRPLQTLSRVPFSSEQCLKLLAIIKGVLTYTRSPEYRPDIDSLTPVQAVVLEVVDNIDLASEKVPSSVLSDLSEYMTLAFVAAFNVKAVDATGPAKRAPQRITYIGLAKAAMPKVSAIYQRYRDDIKIYQQGAAERLLASYAVPMKLKYECPTSSKLGDDPPLWKTATTDFLKTAAQCVRSLAQFGQDEIESSVFEGVWRQVVEGYRGSLLADCHAALTLPREQQRMDENFDLAVLASLEMDIVPSLGEPRVPDYIVQSLAKCLQQGSRLYDLDLPGMSTTASPAIGYIPNGRKGTPSISSSEDGSSRKETRFSKDFDLQAKQAVDGTTADILSTPRERFAYWCFDLLFLTCSDVSVDNESGRRRLAALWLPALLNRCGAVIKCYISDSGLRGKVPFPRIREEELLYVMQRVSSMRLREGTLWAAFTDDPSGNASLDKSSAPIDGGSPPTYNKQALRIALQRSPLAHLFHFYPHFVSLAALSVNRATPTIDSEPVTRPKNKRKGTSAASNVSLAGSKEPAGLGIGADGNPAKGTISDDLAGLPEGIPLGYIGTKRVWMRPLAPSDADGIETDHNGASPTVESNDVSELTRRCLVILGSEIGADW